MALGDENRGVLRQADWGAVDPALVAGTWTEYGRFTVPAGFEYAIGYGHTKGQANSEGRIYGDIVAAGPLDIAGRIRFMLHSAADTPIRKLWEGDIRTLDTSATDRQIMMPLAEVPHFATRDQSIVVQCLADAAATADVSICTLTVDCTVLEVPS
jgi:hypothetical protein